MSSRRSSVMPQPSIACFQAQRSSSSSKSLGYSTCSRLTRSCVEWILDTIEMRYRGLEYFLCTSPDREALPSGTFHPESSAAEFYQHPHSDTLTKFSDETLVSAGQFTAPGMTVLYKAVSATRVNDWLLGSLLDPQGKLEKAQFLWTRPPTDFSYYKMMTYFGTSLKTAQMYASYLKRHDSGCHEFVVIRLCIPDAAFQSLDSTQLVHVHFPSDDWKKLVWHCRRSRSSDDFDRFDKASVIVGNVACRSNKTFRELESWEDVTEEYVMGLESHGGQAEVQYAFSCDNDGREFLTTYATDIKILRYSDREYLQWVEERKNE